MYTVRQTATIPTPHCTVPSWIDVDNYNDDNDNNSITTTSATGSSFDMVQLQLVTALSELLHQFMTSCTDCDYVSCVMWLYAHVW